MELSTPNHGLTRPLFFVVLIVSLGSWFPVGYTTVALNGPQSVIVHWIRSVQCSKYVGSSNSTILSNLTIDDAELCIWCRKISQEEEVRLLADNLRLGTLWALSVASGNLGWFFPSLSIYRS
ncbi:hypothetical protein RvY_03904-2 [Ramazzottius varieornatus]|uniref:Uncharacterized protein n=1 Tax=Ramazzottius varieornatus TaxID=947166 RepID=A0A1D1UPP3_RAMVA|nr:hypothetical protein RvY_03904-2 [Ramazzottius varieornatus]